LESVLGPYYSRQGSTAPRKLPPYSLLSKPAICRHALKCCIHGGGEGGREGGREERSGQVHIAQRMRAQGRRHDASRTSPSLVTESAVSATALSGRVVTAESA
jgi:hypothetical protein